MNYYAKLCFSLALFSALTSHSYAYNYLWDNQEGFVKNKGCQFEKVDETPFNISHYYGKGNNLSENLRNYNGVKQSHLVNFSLVKEIEARAKSNYKAIEVMGVNQSTNARINRWYSKRGDKGYLYHKSLRPIKDYVYRVDSDIFKKGSEELQEEIDKVTVEQNIYLVAAHDDGHWTYNCEEENRRYYVFRAYQVGQANAPLFYLGVSAEETSIFDNINTQNFSTIKSSISAIDEGGPIVELAHNAPAQEIVEQEKDHPQNEEDQSEDEQEVSNDPVQKFDDQGRPLVSVIPKARPDNFSELVERVRETLELERLKSLDNVVCTTGSTLNVRNKELDAVVFRASAGESIKVFQGWLGEDTVTKTISGTEYEFVKVEFHEREEKDQNVGYVARQFVTERQRCRTLDVANPNISFDDIKSIHDKDCCDFPTVQKPTHKYASGGGMRRFGSGRSGGRLHAACDLYRYRNEPVRSVAPGTVVRGLYSFYQGTYALEVRHASGFVVRYGEITGKSVSGVRRGSKVGMGQRIGYVGKVNSGCCRPMLHFELYSGSKNGALSDGTGSYQRRSDLVDPTEYLKKWEANVFE